MSNMIHQGRNFLPLLTITTEMVTIQVDMSRPVDRPGPASAEVAFDGSGPTSAQAPAPEAIRAIGAPVAASPQIPVAARLQQTDVVSGLIDDFLGAGRFDVKDRAGFERCLVRAQMSHPGFIAEFRALVDGLRSGNPSAGQRAGIYRLFSQFGIPYLIDRGRIKMAQGRGDDAKMEGVAKALAETTDFVRRRTEIEAKLTAQLSGRVLLGDGVGNESQVAMRLADAADAGRLPICDLMGVGRRFSLLAEGDERQSANALEALQSVFHAAGMEVGLDVEGRVLRVASRSASPRMVNVVPPAGRASKIDIAVLGPAIEGRLRAFGELELLRAMTEELPLGAVATSRLEGVPQGLSTDVHVSITNDSQISDGRLASLPHDKKVIVIYFHGSGRMSAFGGNFAPEMEKLTEHGVASVGFDMPFHGSGPVMPYLDDPDRFAEWVNYFVELVRKENHGAKIVLVGHCFGSIAILGFLSRYPGGADGAVLMSPGGRYIDEAERQYFEMVTSMFDEDGRGGEIAEVINTRGALWSDTIAKRFGIFEHAPPNIPMRVVMGSEDIIYARGCVARVAERLKGHYGDAMRVDIVEGMGHRPWQYRVGDLEEGVRSRLFGEGPHDTSARLVQWTVVDFLRNELDLWSEVPLESTGRVLDSLSPVRRAMLLAQMNPVFRAVIGDGVDISTDAGAGRALEIWEVAKATSLDRILNNTMGDESGFYGFRRGEMDTFGRALKTQGPDDCRVIRMRNRLAREMMGYLSSAGVRLKGPKSYWSAAAHAAQQLAMLEYREGVVTDMKTWHDPREQDTHGGERASEGLMASAIAYLRREVRQMRVRRARNAASPLKNEYAIANGRRLLRCTFLSRAALELDIEAEDVLSMGHSTDLTLPFGLFRRTKRVVVLSNTPFGSPQEIERYFRSTDIRKALLESLTGFGFPHHRGFRVETWRSGGDILNRVMMGLDAQKIIAIHYFAIGDDGRKVYLNPDPEGNDAREFCNAEVRFLSSLGLEQSVEVIFDSHLRPSAGVRRYLSDQSFGAIYAGRDTADFETRPLALAFYHDMLRRRQIPWVTENRRPAQVVTRVRRSNRPPAYLGASSLISHDFAGDAFIRSANVFAGVDTEGVRVSHFAEGSVLHVARADAFKPEWIHRDTLVHDIDFLHRSRRDEGFLSMDFDREDHRYRLGVADMEEMREAEDDGCSWMTGVSHELAGRSPIVGTGSLGVQNLSIPSVAMSSLVFTVGASMAHLGLSLLPGIL